MVKYDSCFSWNVTKRNSVVTVTVYLYCILIGIAMCSYQYAISE